MTSRLLNSSKEMAKPMFTVEQIAKRREILEQSLSTFLNPIPASLWDDYLTFQKGRQFRFLFQINSLALLAYLFFGVADYYVLPDIGWLSLITRFLSVVLFTGVLIAFFKTVHRIEWLDLYLPYTSIIATIIWFYLLNQSTSRDVLTFQYASVIFIVLANIGVQVRFLASVVPSMLITVCTCIGVYQVSHQSQHELFIFMIAYFPIVMFSLYISFSSTLKNRQNFLNAKLDENSRQALNQMAHTDGLTSLLNRRYFEFLAEQHLQKSRSGHYPLTLLLLDVDHFKAINDNYGHDVGDEILKLISQITSQNIRKHDILARFGGEEFIVLLTDTSLDQGHVIADRICQEMAHTPFVMQSGQHIQFTISIGLAHFNSADDDLRTLIKHADVALYTAKKQGRNRVVVHHHSM